MSAYALLPHSPHEGWRVRWETTRSGFQRFEVFTDRDGVEWIRAASPEATELTVPVYGKGLRPLALKRRSRPFSGKKEREA